MVKVNLHAENGKKYQIQSQLAEYFDSETGQWDVREVALEVSDILQIEEKSGELVISLAGGQKCEVEINQKEKLELASYFKRLADVLEKGG